MPLFPGDFEKAKEFFREALSNEATCVEALYNLGLVNKKLNLLEESLDCFYKVDSRIRKIIKKPDLIDLWSF
jgi:intraflagellar transport protein 88